MGVLLLWALKNLYTMLLLIHRFPLFYRALLILIPEFDCLLDLPLGKFIISIYKVRMAKRSSTDKIWQKPSYSQKEVTMKTKKPSCRINHKNDRIVPLGLILLLIIAGCLTITVHTTSAATYYCDPNGNNNNDGSAAHPWGTLESAVAANKLKPGVGPVQSGDTVKLNAGFHGAPSFYICYTDYVTIEPNDAAVVRLSNIVIKNSSYLRFKGLRISPDYATPSKVARLTGASPYIVGGYNNHHLWVENCNISTAEDTSAWTGEWGYWVWNGIYTSATYSTYRNNTIKNVANGIVSAGNCLFEGNLINGFCYDGMKINGPDSVYQDNIIKNHYADGTGGHDDGMQLNSGGDGNNIIIRRNYICASTDPSRSADSVGGLQGIFLEAAMTDSLIENNVVIVINGTWGIGMWSAVNTKILNNTILKPYGLGSWSDISLTGVFGHVSSNAIVRNNIADSFPSANPANNVFVDHNFDISSYNANVEFVDYPHGNAHLAQGSHFIDAGSSTNVPNEDLERNSRPQGQGYDVGAYEYVTTVLSFAPIGDKEVNEGSILTFTVEVNDPNAEVSIEDNNLPSEPSFANNIFSWTPTYNDAGSYEATFVAQNDLFEDFETITITVNNVSGDGLLGHWKLDDNAGNKTVADSSVNNNTGTSQQNTSVLSTTGKIDSALTFNGSSDYIDCGNGSSLQERSTLTVSAWINGSDYTKPYNMIICGDKKNLDFSWGLRVDNGVAKFFVRAGGYKVATGPSLSVGQWYYVVGVWDRNGGANNLKIYVNGQLQGQSTVNADMDVSTVNVCIGRINFPGINQYFKGLIDDVRIYNKVLSASEITALYCESHSKVSTPTISPNGGTFTD